MPITSDEILKFFNQNQKINYDFVLQKMIEKWKQQNTKPSVLLHSCCAPCSTYTLEYLVQHAEVTIYFANPNIHPKSEYLRRLYEQQKFILNFNEKTGNYVRFIGETYRVDEYVKHVSKGLEAIPEGGKRCESCFAYRLDIAAQKAQELNFDYFGSALTLSPMKNSQLINRLGIQIQYLYDTNYLPSDFKKNNGYKRSIEICNEYDVYRQCYCGCIFAAKDQNIDLKVINKDATSFNKTKENIDFSKIQYKHASEPEND